MYVYVQYLVCVQVQKQSYPSEIFIIFIISLFTQNNTDIAVLVLQW